MELKINDTGSLVEALQLGLNRSGYLSEEPDGIFGNNTKQAVSAFQKAFGLEGTGIADEDTLQYIERFIRGYYTRKIKKGDTLWQIAASSGISLNSLIAANPLADPLALVPDSEIVVPYGFDIVPDNISYSYYLTQLILRGLKMRYPFISLKNEGKSVQNKSIDVLRVGTGRKEIFINAGFHANEWLNIPVVLKFTEEFLKASIEERDIYSLDTREIYQNVTIHIMPLVNPDGLDLVTGALNSGEYFLKAKEISESYPFVPFTSGWKANINGVDLNLQFPAQWERAREIKFSQDFTSPSPIEYVGSAPLTEPEAVCAYNYTLKNDFRMILAYHSQGSIIYWKYDDFLPPESERIGIALSEASGYPLEITPPDSSFAGYKDWFISQYNRPGYTIETGMGTNPLPVSDFGKIYEANKMLIAKALEETMSL